MSPTCKKVRYGSRHAVHQANRTNGKRVRAYFCLFCRWWHSTTQPRRGAA